MSFSPAASGRKWRWWHPLVVLLGALLYSRCDYAFGQLFVETPVGMEYSISDGRIIVDYPGRRGAVARGVRAVLVCDMSTANYMPPMQPGQGAPEWIGWYSAPCKVVWAASLDRALAEYQPQGRLQLSWLDSARTDPLPPDVLNRLEGGELDVLVARDAQHVDLAQPRKPGRGLF